jgi:hypothetical protein
MKIYHSYWSKGYAGSPPAYVVDLHNLSAYLAKKQYGEIHLITDTEGKKHLGGIEYTSISTDLDALPVEYGTVWSLGKLLTYNKIAARSEPFMHIDYDVLLWKKLPETFTASPVFAERLEQKVDWRYNVTNFHKRCPNHHDLKTLVADGALNAGVFGGTDLDLIYRVTHRAMAFVLDPDNKAFMTSTDATINIPSWSRATIAEQLYIYQYCLMNNKDVTFLINGKDFIEQDQQCVDFGYSHLWGKKHLPDTKHRIYKRMEEFKLQTKEDYTPDISWAVGGALKALTSFGHKKTEQSEQRLAVCQSCPEWNGKSCRVCGCYVTLKVRIPEEKCPHGKW